MDGQRVLAACGLPFEAAIARGPGVMALHGLGPARMAALLTGALAQGRFAGIISFGCAAGLDPGLAPGSCVVAGAVVGARASFDTDPAWSRALRERLPAARAGLLAGLDAPLAASSDKKALWRESGAIAADMESLAAAMAAREHGLPFAVCRVVLDDASSSVPACALAAMREDGRMAWAPLLRSLAGAPGQLAPLCALARAAWLARRGLGQARARFGVRLALPGP